MRTLLLPVLLGLSLLSGCVSAGLAAKGSAGAGGAGATSSAGASGSGGRGTSGAGGSAGAQSCWALEPVNRVRFFPAPGKAAQMVGGQFAGSNDTPTNGFTTLGTITKAPIDGQWSELTFTNTTPYRYVKYFGPSNSYGAVAELEFYDKQTRLSGPGFGTAGSLNNSGNTWQKALDGDTSTYFEAAQPNDQYVGLDAAGDHLADAPVFSPGGGLYAAAQTVTITTKTAGATIHYTIDGTEPSDASPTYLKAIQLGNGATQVKAFASKACMYRSDEASALYRIGANATAFSSLHIGNSLTDTIVGWLEPIATSAGYTLDFNRYTIPGAGTWEIATSPTGGFGVANVRDALATLSYDQISFQPFPNMPCQPTSTVVATNPWPTADDPSASDALYIDSSWNLAKAVNPKVQIWVYQQWPQPPNPKTANAWFDCLSGGGWTRGDWKPPTPNDWEAAVGNQRLYHEAVRAQLVLWHPSDPPPYVVPGGDALVKLKHEVEAGRVPGITDFFPEIFATTADGPGTDIHLTNKGRYLISLVFFAVMFQDNPQGKVMNDNTDLTAEQAAIFQRIAWDTVTGYALSGINR